MDNISEIKVLLLVEDSENDIILTQRKIFRSTLKIEEFLIARSLQEALAVLSQKSVDVVFLDLNLPESKELDTLDAILKVYTGILIVITSIDSELIGVEAIRKGADDYIVKSSLTEDILARSVIYARERRHLHEKAHAMKEKLESLTKMTGV